MLYDAVANTHGLAIDSFKALVAPRSIGWISTLGKNGIVNLAAYSFFNAVSEDPHFLMFGSDGRKDSQHQTLTRCSCGAPSRLVAPPRVKESPVAFECRYWRTIELPGRNGKRA